MTRVVIEVSGGCVQNITSDSQIEVLLLDYDNIEAGDEPEVGYPVNYDIEHVNQLFDNLSSNKKLDTYELTLEGFDINTDETDQLVKWINAPTKESLEMFLERVWQPDNFRVMDLLQETPRLLSGRKLKVCDGVDIVLDEEGRIVYAMEEIEYWKIDVDECMSQ